MVDCPGATGFFWTGVAPNLSLHIANSAPSSPAFAFRPNTCWDHDVPARGFFHCSSLRLSLSCCRTVLLAWAQLLPCVTWILQISNQVQGTSIWSVCVDANFKPGPRHYNLEEPLSFLIFSLSFFMSFFLSFFLPFFLFTCSSHSCD